MVLVQRAIVRATMVTKIILRFANVGIKKCVTMALILSMWIWIPARCKDGTVVEYLVPGDTVDRELVANRTENSSKSRRM